LVRDDAAFNNGILGFAAPAEDLNYLQLLAGYVNSSLGSYYHFLTSSSWGVERDFIEENEHLALPFAEPSPGLAARIIRAVEYAEHSDLLDTAWQTNLDAAVFEAYELTTEEADLVNDTLRNSLDQFKRRAQSSAFRPPTDTALADYMHALRETLSGMARSLDVRVWLPHPTPAFAAVSVAFLERQDPSAGGLPAEQAPVVETLLRRLQTVTDGQPSPVTIVQPAAIVMQDHEVHIIKAERVAVLDHKQGSGRRRGDPWPHRDCAVKHAIDQRPR
jgi:hypothetical protein